jgi:hypothetical protein
VDSLAATLEIDASTVGIWMTELPGGNWMAVVNRAPEGRRFRIAYRFRWYRDRKAWDSKDVRRRYATVVTNETEGSMISKMREMWTVFASLASVKLGADAAGWELIRGGLTVAEFVDRLATMPGISTKRFNADGTEEKEAL